MLRSAVILAILLLSTTVQAQKHSGVSFLIGLGAGLPIFQSIEEQDYAVELYAQTRDHTIQFQIGARFNLDAKNKLELIYKRTRYKIDESKFITDYENRFPDQYFYPSYTLGNQNGLGHRHALNSLNVNYGREIGGTKLSFFPYVGFGIGLTRLYDFFYILRDKNSNYATDYSIHLKKNVHPTYTLGARLGITKIPWAHLEFSIHGGPNKYNYEIEVNPQDPSLAEFTTNVSFNRFVQSVNLSLVFKVDEFEEQKENLTK